MLNSIVSIGQKLKGSPVEAFFERIGKISCGAVLALALVGCTLGPSAMTPYAITPATEPAMAPTDFVYADPATALPGLILAERQAVAAGDLTRLEQLWAADGNVVDARHSADPSDDYRWHGRTEILDRYVVAVFPNHPPFVADLGTYTLQQKGRSATIQVGRDRWRFVQRDGRWWLYSLVYHWPKK